MQNQYLPDTSFITSLITRAGDERRALQAQEQAQADDRLNQQEALYTSQLLRTAPEQRMALIQQGYAEGVFDDDDMQAFQTVPAADMEGLIVDKLRIDGYGELLPSQYQQGGGSKGLPSSVQETVWYNQQTPEVQKAHMSLKRRAEQSPEAKLAYEQQLNEIKLELEKQKLLLESNVAADTSEQDANTQAEKEAAKKLGALRGDILADETKSFRNVRSQKLQLNQLEKALEAADTGKYAQLKSFAGKYMPGVDVDNEQALQSIVTQYALSELQKQTGPKTDFDFIKAAETQVQAGNTKGANKIILERMKENARYAESRYEAFKKFKKDRKDFENFEYAFSYESDYGGIGSEDAEYEALKAELGI